MHDIDQVKHHEKGRSNEGNEVIKLQVEVQSFNVAEQPDSSEYLPSAIKNAKLIWERNSFECNAEILELVQPFLGCAFIAENLEDWNDWLDDHGHGEFEADQISVIDVDFSAQPIPTTSLKCTIVLRPANGVDATKLKSYLELNEFSLGGCIIPRWAIEDCEGIDDLDLTVGDHGGIEVSIASNQ